MKIEIVYNTDPTKHTTQNNRQRESTHTIKKGKKGKQNGSIDFRLRIICVNNRHPKLVENKYWMCQLGTANGKLLDKSECRWEVIGI